MARRPDLSGRVFGRLTVVRPDGRIGKNGASFCRCECGEEKRVMNQNLLSGRTISCGCWKREAASQRVKNNPPRLKHGLKGSITYNSWHGMIRRCRDRKSKAYPRYGGAGVTVCDRWADMDDGLLNFIEDMGHRPSEAHTIDRKDGTKGYEPGNCRWATRPQQNQNVGLKNSNSSGYKGLTKTRHGRWSAGIRADGVRIGLGTYRTKEAAALAYNIASEKLHGEFGVRNALPPMKRKTCLRVFRKVELILSSKERK